MFFFDKKIIPISAFKDNYIWMFGDDASRKAWVVDPGDARPVLSVLKKMHYDLSGVLITHHHHDHSGGVSELVKHWKNIPVWGSHLSSIEFITHRVKEDDVISCGPFDLNILDIPGHTLDHVAFYNKEILFSGDTLFSVGCGRIFEGTPAQMYHTINKLLQLPEEVKIFCGHEYTLSNLLFAQHVDPKNQYILDAMRAVKILREKNQPTLPSSLGKEKKCNPFLRCEEPEIIAAIEKYAGKKLNNSVEVFAYLREWKNQF